MNVFVASGGRRTSLVAAFKEAAARHGGEVYVGDVDGLAPALYTADHAVCLPRIDSPEYIPFLLNLAERNRIALLIPTLDTELPLFAAARSEFSGRGCEVAISDPELVCITGDKWKTVSAFAARGIRTPLSWLPETATEFSLPKRLFVKPRNGSASKNAFPVSRGELFDILPHIACPIIQEELTGDEVTIDALLDFSCKPVHYVPRRRIRTLGGESIQGVTIEDSDIREWVVRVLEVISELGGRGPITIQLFLTPEGPVLSEINPRFGGGFPLAWQAGGRYPEWLLQMRAGQEVRPCIGQYRRGLYMTRSYTECFIEQPVWG